MYFGFARFTTKIIFEGKSYFGQHGGSLGVECTRWPRSSVYTWLHARNYFGVCRVRARLTKSFLSNFPSLPRFSYILTRTVFVPKFFVRFSVLSSRTASPPLVEFTI